MYPITFEEHQKQLQQWERELRADGWVKGERNLWTDPDRPAIKMSLRSAYYTLQRKGRRQTTSITK